MKNTAINTLQYTGIVTLSQYIGTKKIKIAQVHNTGGSVLFDFLSDCLVGDIEKAQTKKPTKLRLVNYVQVSDNLEDGYTFKSASAGFIYLLSSPKKTSSSSESSVTYSFLIPREFLENVQSFSGLGLGLYTNSTTDDESMIPDFVAFCKLPEIHASRNVLTKSSLVVDWKLVISNANTTVQPVKE